MAFRTKLDFSDNRQIKQRPETTTVLSGTTVFGVPFSALTHGPDLLATGQTSTLTNVSSTFSGNATTTTYNFGNSNMNLAVTGLFTPLSANLSATTQYTKGFTAKTTTVIDGNTVVLIYSGVSYDFTPTTYLNLGGGNYSGQATTQVLQFLTAGTLDFTGRTIWVDVSGITRTKQLIATGDAQFTNIGSAAQAGSLHYTSDGTLTVNTSDKRLKTNIVPITGALGKVLSLSGIYYNWALEPTGDKRIGFIAQEVAKAVPELAFVNKKSPELYMGVHYDNVTPLLVEALKELVSSGGTITSKSVVNTQTIIAEDNDIELNFNGNYGSSIGGGMKVLHAMSEDGTAEFVTDKHGDWITNNNLKPMGLVIPFYTPQSALEIAELEGSVTRDNEYLYIKTNTGWKRTKLETF
jgi:hypothetical protein